MAKHCEEATTKLDLIPAESGVRRVGIVDVSGLGPTARVLRGIRAELAKLSDKHCCTAELRHGVWHAVATINADGYGRPGVVVAEAYRPDGVPDGVHGRRAALAAVLFELKVMS